MSEETTKYQKEWDDYTDRQINTWLVGICFVIIFVVLVIVVRKYPAYEKIGEAFVILTIVGWILYGLYCLVTDNYWKCPRCQEIYYFPNSWKTNNKCQNCNLPKYYDSSYFYGKWGTERGKDLAKQIEEEKL